MDGKDNFWYSDYISDLDPYDLSLLQWHLNLDSTYELRLPSPNEHPSSPPEGFVTVFRDQILGGLRFPLHPFFSEICQYCGIGLSQFAPNVFQAVCGTIILRAEPGVFNVQAKPGYKFFDDLPSSNKGWKSRFFFLRPSVPLAGPSQWCSILSSDFPVHIHEPSCSTASDKLSGVVVHLSVLMLEGILYAFGLSPVPTEIGAPFVAALLRSFASQEKPTVVVLQALHEELTQGPSTAPAAPADLQPLEPQTSDVGVPSTYIEPLSSGPVGSAPLHAPAPPTTEPPSEGQVPPPPPTMKLRLARKGKRVAPVTATSPPPPRRQRVVSISSPSRSLDASSAEERASDLETANLSLDLAALLQRENAALKARLRELEPPVASTTSSDPALGDLDAYLRAAGESANSARALSHATFDKLQKLEASLKTSESALASEMERHRATASELKNKEAELLSRSYELALLRQSRELLQMGLAETQAQVLASAAEEATMRGQWETCRAALQSLEADLSKAREAISQSQSDLSVVRAEAASSKNSLVVYQAGEPERLKAYRLAYIRSALFLRKLAGWMVLLLCHGVAGGVRQAFEQGYLHSAPPATFLDTARLSRELPQNTFPSFEADDGLFLLEAPPPAADQAPPDISAQGFPTAAPGTPADPASSSLGIV
ncbi:uncharacterized protein LOC122050189 [Zingiber officinale]|uniref:uncharacterized protein LOC122050189 n=1 Tax=Zingiber officinale TaxID=94328 RepID=UPI001C4CE524|nr:uncharacterized protein LOC122050189 [Zingiber officinale]